MIQSSLHTSPTSSTLQSQSTSNTCRKSTSFTLPRDSCIHVFLSSYPGPTIRALELLQQERFRKDILIPETVARMAEEGLQASTDGLHRD
jgi:hypothetical protein